MEKNIFLSLIMEKKDSFIVSRIQTVFEESEKLIQRKKISERQNVKEEICKILIDDKTSSKTETSSLQKALQDILKNRERSRLLEIYTLLCENVDLHQLTGHGENLLHLAARTGEERICTKIFLKSLNANVKLEEKRNNSLLYPWQVAKTREMKNILVSFPIIRRFILKEKLNEKISCGIRPNEEFRTPQVLLQEIVREEDLERYGRNISLEKTFVSLFSCGSMIQKAHPKLTCTQKALTDNPRRKRDKESTLYIKDSACYDGYVTRYNCKEKSKPIYSRFKSKKLHVVGNEVGLEDEHQKVKTKFRQLFKSKQVNDHSSRIDIKVTKVLSAFINH
eukprot:snap_masked-scaffold_16-processed-gene-5.54-mRNA-1 protein AED:1.00 eAED:1.00 QI:0/-1/0/0/-1/1/1/0/335